MMIFVSMLVGHPVINAAKFKFLQRTYSVTQSEKLKKKLSIWFCFMSSSKLSNVACGQYSNKFCLFCGEKSTTVWDLLFIVQFINTKNIE